jgi:hypothetical protein
MSCATHDLSDRIPVKLEIRNVQGEVIDTIVG